jgi:single-strand DNA-binding protein
MPLNFKIMEITGRVTADAAVRRAGEREVVNFSIAVNDRYKPAGSTEYKQVTTFINCSYWMSVKVAQWIRKGAVVLLGGRLGMHVYINSDGNPIGSIDLHVNSLSIIAFAKHGTDADGSEAGKAKKGNGKISRNSSKQKDSDDVPF